ncbi:prevent-host-death family protein [Marvinbryantia formatexigens DSM 14469]|uniref:Prevent-host-death family protein n=1 Tax=Marvinbryantia formatexigens DSM 14469 TaxID=478749 RepID=C6LL35_9FIRM|nr:ATP-binding cassette domain-containing protein [Marvinbryantia formatexigens]EET58654.1 prevent-host-death family protein [Marvinbryantia formatexigens DSM 14469]UWO23376.1 ATP-binding cassette domain-containing protein [Marvinbryantia formatexigens DSM 14469]
MKQEIFRMERVTYLEQEIMLLEDFNLQIYRGEIMGMIPVNAHGMTAFLKLLQNNLPLYDGYIYYGGEKINSWKESKKQTNRISIIEGKSRLVENMTVLDNIFVLRQSFGQEIVRTKLLGRQLAPFFADIGIDISADARVETLSEFERVVVELLRAVVMGHRLIVLNDIGTLISFEEMKKLHEILRHYAAQGFSFLYICPHFEEVVMICDRSAMLSNGRIQKIVRREEMADEILRLYPAEYDRMVRSHLESRQNDRERHAEVLRTDGLCGEYVRDFGFVVSGGECLVIQIQENHIFQELVQMITGEKEPEAGELYLLGKPAKFSGNEKLAVIQELPTKSMVFPKLSYMENLCISLSGRMPFIWLGRGIRSSIRREYGPILGEEVFDMSVEELSEKQKYQMIYTRVLLQKPRIVFCVQPFKGADLPHRMFVWKMLEILLAKGISVVILTMMLSDSLSLADRLLVVNEDGSEKEVMRQDFASISSVTPWIHLYKK